MTDLSRVLEQIGLQRRFAVDVLSVAKGIRRIGLLHAPQDAEPKIRAAITDFGLTTFARRELYRQDDPDSREGILRDCNKGEAGNFIELWFARHDEPSLPAPEALFAKPGLCLGYPSCCVAEWERLKSQRNLYDRYIFETSFGHWEINRLAALFHEGLLIPDFFPCSLSCDAAREFARPIIGLAEEILDHTWVQEVVRWMHAPILGYAGFLYAFPTWSFAGPELELSTLEAIRIPLKEIASFGRSSQDGCRLITFRHLSSARSVVFVSGDGSRTALTLD